MHIVDHGNNARISRRRQMYSLSGGVVPPAYLSHLLFQAGGTDWSSFNQQVGPPSFVGGFAVLDGVDDYLGADFIQDYDGCSIWAVVEVTATNSAQDTVIQVGPGTTAIVSVEAAPAAANSLLCIGRMGI